MQLLEFFPFFKSVENHPEALASLDGYLSFCYEQLNKKELKILEKYIISIFHCIDYKEIVKCETPGCGFETAEEAPETLGFFLS